MPTVRFVVSGRVQGVFFRASARNEALRLGITGYAKNLEDGRVEVLASGEEENLEALQTWLRVGPPSASVERVEREVVAEQAMSGFVTR